LGFIGGVEPLAEVILPYYADYSAEVIFQVSTLLQSKSSAAVEYRKKIITKNFILIAWMEEDVESYTFDSFPVKGNDLHIIVHPQSSGLYRVRVGSKLKERFSIGPLLDNMLVRKENLGHLVRATAMNDHKLIQSVKDNQWPYAVRRGVISEIATKYRKEEPIEQFYSSLFTPIPTSANLAPPSFTAVTGIPPYGSNFKPRAAPSRSISEKAIIPTSPTTSRHVLSTTLEKPISPPATNSPVVEKRDSIQPSNRPSSPTPLRQPSSSSLAPPSFDDAPPPPPDDGPSPSSTSSGGGLLDEIKNAKLKKKSTPAPSEKPAPAKSSTGAPDLMESMKRKLAERRKHVDENEDWET